MSRALGHGIPALMQGKLDQHVRSAPQQHINRTVTTGIARRVGEGQDAAMPAENVAHARPQHSNVAWRTQPAAVHDAHAAMARATPLNQRPHARLGFAAVMPCRSSESLAR